MTSAAMGAGAVNPFATSKSPAGGGGSNPFSLSTSGAPSTAVKEDTTHTRSDNDESTVSLSATFAEKARLAPPQPENNSNNNNNNRNTNIASAPPSKKSSPWPDLSAFPPPYPHLHLDADYETLDAPPNPATNAPTITPSADDTFTGITASGPDGAEDRMLFESSMDKTFQKFADRVAQNPEQVLRYEFMGTPLLYSASDAVGALFSPGGTESSASSSMAARIQTVSTGPRIPRCGNCGAARAFEVQLTPRAIAELEEGGEDMLVDGMDWGSVIMAVCGEDCGERGVGSGRVGYVEEWVGVQWEELEERKK